MQIPHLDEGALTLLELPLLLRLVEVVFDLLGHSDQLMVSTEAKHNDEYYPYQRPIDDGMVVDLVPQVVQVVPQDCQCGAG